MPRPSKYTVPYRRLRSLAPSAKRSTDLLNNINNAPDSHESDSSASESESEGDDIPPKKPLSQKRSRDTDEDVESGSSVASSRVGKRRRLSRLERESSRGSRLSDGKLQRLSASRNGSRGSSHVNNGDIFDLPQSPKRRRVTVHGTQITSQSETRRIKRGPNGRFLLGGMNKTDAASEHSDEVGHTPNKPRRKSAKQGQGEEEREETGDNNDDDDDDDPNTDSLIPATSSAFVSQDSGIKKNNPQISNSIENILPEGDDADGEWNGVDEEKDGHNGDEESANEGHPIASPENKRRSSRLHYYSRSAVTPRRSARLVDKESSPQRRSRRQQVRQDADKDEHESDGDESSMDDTENERLDTSISRAESPVVVVVQKSSPASKKPYSSPQASGEEKSSPARAASQVSHDSMARHSLSTRGSPRSPKGSAMRKTPIPGSSFGSLFRAVETSTPKRVPASRDATRSPVVLNTKKGTPQQTLGRERASKAFSLSPAGGFDLFVSNDEAVQGSDSSDVSDNDYNNDGDHFYRNDEDYEDMPDDDDDDDGGDSSLEDDEEFLIASCAFEQKENWSDLLFEARKLVREPRPDAISSLIRKSVDKVVSRAKDCYERMVALRMSIEKNDSDDLPGLVKEQEKANDDIKEEVDSILPLIEIRPEDDSMDAAQWEERKTDILSVLDELRGYVIPQLSGLVKQCLVTYYVDGEIQLPGMKQLTHLLELLSKVCKHINPEPYKPRIWFDDELQIIRIVARSLAYIFKVQLLRMEEQMQKQRTERIDTPLAKSPRNERTVSSARQSPKRPREPEASGDEYRDESSSESDESEPPRGAPKRRQREISQSISRSIASSCPRERSKSSTSACSQPSVALSLPPRVRPSGGSRNTAIHIKNKPVARQPQNEDKAVSGNIPPDDEPQTRDRSESRNVEKAEDTWTDEQSAKLLEGLYLFRGPTRYVKVVEKYESHIGKRSVDAVERKARIIRDNLIKAKRKTGEVLDPEAMGWLLNV